MRNEKENRLQELGKNIPKEWEDLVTQFRKAYGGEFIQNAISKTEMAHFGMFCQKYLNHSEGEAQ